MLLFSLLYTALVNAKKEQLAKKRNMWNFARLTYCVTDRWPYDYVNYGCHCGKGGGGNILDEIDRYDFCVSVLCTFHPISHFEIEKETGRKQKQKPQKETKKLIECMLPIYSIL